MRRSQPVTRSAGRRRPGPPGSATLGAGVLLAVLSMLLTVRISYPTGLGVVLVLAHLYLVTAYVLTIGLVRLRAGAGGVTGAATTTAWVCLVRDHRFDRVAERPDTPEHWRCRRCGKRRYTRPRSAGETLTATQVDMLWIRRGDDL